MLTVPSRPQLPNPVIQTPLPLTHQPADTAHAHAHPSRRQEHLRTPLTSCLGPALPAYVLTPDSYLAVAKTATSAAAAAAALDLSVCYCRRDLPSSYLTALYSMVAMLEVTCQSPPARVTTPGPLPNPRPRTGKQTTFASSPATRSVNSVSQNPFSRAAAAVEQQDGPAIL
ncbi:hypothetical protein V494_02130 [Pseudogymnoascus sp. VKM F-4513 (FW-928)]|nr:hypothetical protein V494_02130 [Pseudogymnoascus sp. VKM F-4513 (FW-928)]